jgi:hypothetical protein
LRRQKRLLKSINDVREALDSFPPPYHEELESIRE